MPSVVSSACESICSFPPSHPHIFLCISNRLQAPNYTAWPEKKTLIYIFNSLHTENIHRLAYKTSQHFSSSVVALIIHQDRMLMMGQLDWYVKSSLEQL